MTAQTTPLTGGLTIDMTTGMTTHMTIGLTGGIGSGKSTVASLLVACGAHLVDTDAIARALTQPGGKAMPQLRDVFGDAAITPEGALDREYMRQRVFADPGAKQQLEAVIHPLIGSEALRQAALANGRTVVYDVPLLAESQGARPWRARVNRVLVVDCSEDTQRDRVAARPGWSRELADRVMAQQATRAQRRNVADAVIHNDGITLTQLQTEVQAIWSTWNHDSRPR